MVRPTRMLWLVAVAALPASAAAEPWSRARINHLPDAAFAAVERAPDGRAVRHLPHHDETGKLDLPHLRAARARFGQVRWLDPASAEIARRHLEEHVRDLTRGR
jgi:hypothetical protein